MAKDKQFKPAVLESEIIHRGKAFSFIREEIELTGGASTEMAFVRHPGSTGILALFDDDTVAMTRQYRHPVGAYVLEIPAGTMDPGEEPLACARRELEEETGLIAAQWEKLTEIHILPSYSDEVIHLFAARDLTRTHQNLDEDEILEMVTYPLETLTRMVKNGQITDALTILALQWICLKRDIDKK